MKRSIFLLLIALLGFCWSGVLGDPIPASGQTIHRLQVSVIKGQFLDPNGKSVYEYDYLEPGHKYRLLPETEIQLSTLDGKKIYVAIGPGVLLLGSSGSVLFNGNALKPKAQQSLLQDVTASKVPSRELAGLPFRGIKVVARTEDGGTRLLPLYSGYYALVVGVSNYEKWPKLPNAAKDAKDVAEKLKKLGFHVKLVLNPTSSELRRALNDLTYTYGRDKNQALLFFYAGHGETEVLADGTKLGYIIPRDCPLLRDDPHGFVNRAISMKDIEAYSLRIRSKHVLMLFDSCFSGALFALIRAVPHDITEKSTMPVRQYITAGREDEEVPDRSMFKRCLLIGLDGDADLTGDGYITGSELGMYLADKVVNYTHRGQHPQYGKINNPDLDRGDFIFVPLKQRLKEAEQEKERQKQELALAEQVKKMQEQMKELLERKWETENKTKDALTEKKDLEEKLKREADERTRKEALAEAKIKELEARYKASLEKLEKEAANKQVLEEELKKKKEIEQELKRTEREQQAAKGSMTAKITDLDKKRKAAEEKARKEANAKKELEEELNRVKSKMKETTQTIQELKTKQAEETRVAYIPKKAIPDVLPPSSIDSKLKEIARDERFIAYANGTVLDTKTNLMWAAKDDGKGLIEGDAEDYIEDYQGGGFTDWRMPTMDELETIYDRDLKNQHGYYVSKLIGITDARVWGSEGWGNMWAFDFSRGSPVVDGSFETLYRSFHLGSARALPVRDAKHMKARMVVKDERREKKGITSASRKTVVASLIPGPVVSKDGEIARDGRFIAYANGTVLDTKTNLMWAGTDAGVSSLYHSDAESYCERYRGGGYTDWRMPTVDELEVLYNKNLFNQHGYHITKLIDVGTDYIWADHSSWGGEASFNFKLGSPAVDGYRDGRGIHSRSARALPVRDAKHMKARVVVKDERKEKKGITSAPRKTVVASLSPGPIVSKGGEIARDGRFIANADGTVLDTKTNLIWAAKDDGKGLIMEDAKDYIENYQGGGYTDWRMPTMDELETIYKRNPENQDGYHFTKLIDITAAWVWGSEGWGNMWVFDFSRGSPVVPGLYGHRSRSNLDPSARALPVRAGN